MNTTPRQLLYYNLLTAIGNRNANIGAITEEY